MVGRIALAAFALLVIPGRVAGQDASLSQPAVAVIQKDESIASSGKIAGTGFLVSRAGHVLTAHHVVEGELSVFVSLCDRGVGGRVADVVDVHPLFDLALLRLRSLADTQLPAPIPLAESAGTLDERLTVFGYHKEDKETLPCHEISTTVRSRDHDGLLTLEGLPTKGYSGGAVLDSQGRAIAVVTEMSQARDEFYAVPVEFVHRFLRRYGLDAAGDFEHELATLGRIQSELESFRSVSRFILTDLRWEAKLEYAPQVAARDAEAPQNVLRLEVRFEKRFPYQYRPDEVDLIIYPVLDRLSGEQLSGYRPDMRWETSREFLGDAEILLIGGIETELRGAIRRYNEEKGASVKLKDVREILVEIHPRSSDGTLEFEVNKLKIAWGSR